MTIQTLISGFYVCYLVAYGFLKNYEYQFLGVWVDWLDYQPDDLHSMG